MSIRYDAFSPVVRIEGQQDAGEESVQRRERALVGLDHVQAEHRDRLDYRRDLEPAIVAEGVDGARDRRRQLLAIDEASLLQLAKPVGQQVGGDAGQLAAQVTVAAGAADELAQDQQRPSLAQHVEAERDRTVLLVTPRGME